MTPPDDGRIGNYLNDVEAFADLTPAPVAEQLVPDDAAFVKADYILRALIAAGLKTPFGFDIEVARQLWAGRLGQYSINDLETAIGDWVGAPGNDFPSLGDLETVVKELHARRIADSPEERARTARGCSTCDGLHHVRVKQKSGIIIPTGKTMVPTEIEVSVMRPCPDCPEMKERSDLWERGHFDADHQDKGGCPSCWKYMPTQAHRAKAVERERTSR
jgi:hypothetical protein